MLHKDTARGTGTISNLTKGIKKKKRKKKRMEDRLYKYPHFTKRDLSATNATAGES